MGSSALRMGSERVLECLQHLLPFTLLCDPKRYCKHGPSYVCTWTAGSETEDATLETDRVSTVHSKY